MNFADLVATSQAVGATRSRKKKIGHLAALLHGLDGDQLGLGVSYLMGVLPQGKIGVGWAALRDLDVEPAASADLSIETVDAAMTTIQKITGSGSKAKRSAVLVELFSSTDADGQDFLRRLIIGDLRQGAMGGVMADAVADAFELSHGAVRRAAMLSGDLAAVAVAARDGGEPALAEFRLTLMRPVQPMLAQSAETPEEALERLGSGLVEWKLDGARLQIHRDGDRIEAYSRNLRRVTHQVPGIVARLAALPLQRFIVDGEALMLRPARDPVPFQETMSRFGRQESGADETLDLFLFDALLIGDDELIDMPLEDRHQAWVGHFPEQMVTPSIIAHTPDEARRHYEAAVDAGHEGVVVKALDAPYEAGRRGAGWIKVKPTHTLDLVVLAVEWGSGRRSGWLSNIHLGARDPDSGGFVMLGKTFKGMTDEMLAWQTDRFQELETHRAGHVVHVRPEQVVEIAFDSVLQSSRYPGGMALRFARVKRYRDDKTAGEADTVATVRSFFESTRGGA